MAVHRRQLPIVGPCDGFVVAPGSERGEGGFCERCQRQVHDVSSMRESELHALLDAHEGQGVCLSYRVDRRGYVRMRPEPRFELRPMTLGAFALLLAACAGHFAEDDTRTWACRHPAGHQVECPVWGDRNPDVVPDAFIEPTPAEEGCPVRPTADALAEERPPVAGEPSQAAGGEAEGTLDGAPPPEPSDVSPTAVGTHARFRANFMIDPDVENRAFLGVVVGWSPQDRRTGRLRYVPTATLLDDWRARRAERKAARERRRTAARR